MLVQVRELGPQPSRSRPCPKPERAASCCLGPTSVWGRAEASANSTVETKKIQAIDFLAFPLHRDRSGWKRPQGDIDFMPCVPRKGHWTQSCQQAGLGQSSSRRHLAPSRSPGLELQPLGGRTAPSGTRHRLQQTIWLPLLCKEQGKPSLQRLQQVSKHGQTSVVFCQS